MNPALLHRRRLLGGVDGGDVVAVRLHHALRGTGGARRVDDRRQIGRARRRHALRERGLMRVHAVASESAQRLPRHHHLGRLGRVVPGDDDDLLERRHPVAGLQHFGELHGILDDDRPGARIVHDVGDQIRRIGRIHGNGHAAGAEDREVRLNPLGSTRRQQRDRVALAAPERQQAERDFAHDVADLAPGDRLPVGAVLELLRRPISAPLHTVPEHPRKRIGCHAGLPVKLQYVRDTHASTWRLTQCTKSRLTR